VQNIKISVSNLHVTNGVSKGKALCSMWDGDHLPPSKLEVYNNLYLYINSCICPHIR
jgi:hypothetical protein